MNSNFSSSEQNTSFCFIFKVRSLSVNLFPSNVYALTLKVCRNLLDLNNKWLEISVDWFLAKNKMLLGSWYSHGLFTSENYSLRSRLNNTSDNKRPLVTVENYSCKCHQIVTGNKLFMISFTAIYQIELCVIIVNHGRFFFPQSYTLISNCQILI